MIEHIQGTVTSKTEGGMVVAAGPLGMHIAVPHPESFQQGQDVSLFIYLHWNQEQGPSLYGFAEKLDKTVFLLIISCSGIGPKMALALLAQLGAKQCLQAIAHEQTSVLSKAPGIGAKKAEQLIVHLRGKVAKLLASGDCGDMRDVGALLDISQALSSLHYTPAEIAATMRHLGALDQAATLPFDQLMRTALSFLAKKN